jgi:hypothetical protein
LLKQLAVDLLALTCNLDTSSQVSELSATLGNAGVRRLVVPVDEKDEEVVWKKWVHIRHQG